MLDCLRTHRTKQELDAGLREKILKYREAVDLSHKLYDEIETVIREKDLDGNFAYAET